MLNAVVSSAGMSKEERVIFYFSDQAARAQGAYLGYER